MRPDPRHASFREQPEAPGQVSPDRGVCADHAHPFEPEPADHAVRRDSRADPLGNQPPLRLQAVDLGVFRRANLADRARRQNSGAEKHRPRDARARHRRVDTAEHHRRRADPASPTSGTLQSVSVVSL